MKHSLWDALPRWLLCWLVCFALDLGLGALLKADSRWWLVMAALLLWCAMLAAAERFGRFPAMLALWAAALGVVLLAADPHSLKEAAAALASRTGTAGGYGELCLLLLCAAAALPLSALLRVRQLRLTLSLCWTGLWIAAALGEWPLPRAVPAAMIPLLLLSLTETIRRLRREPEPEGKPRGMLLLSLLPAALLLALLPAPAEPYGYPLLHAVADRVEELWHDTETALRYRHRGEGEFALSFNGISDEAGLGESNEGKAPGILYVKPGQEPDGAAYLFGNAWDHFDGRNWSSTLDAKSAELLNWRLDTAEHVYALWRLLDKEDGGAVFSDYFRANSVYLVCRKMNMRTMFGVMDTTHIFTDAERFPYADAPTGSRFDYVQRDEVWYRIYFLESNARTRGALIAASEGTVYDAEARGSLWERVARDFERDFRLDLGDDTNLERVLARRAALIRSAYLDVSGVSERAKALAEEITADCGSDYEKVRAIAAYLQGHYRYTVLPEPVPEGEDFLDWLLFESREGYCAWYATAATLLSRSVGVPARYVQGYRGELDGEVFTPLDPADAHAWCECYIGGYGWVTVEATPGFGSDGDGWLTAAEEEALHGSAADPAAAPEERPRGETDGILLPGQSAPAEQEAVSEESAGKTDDARSRFNWLPIPIAAAVPALLLALRLRRRRRRKKRYEAADGATRLRMDLEQLLRDLRGKGYPRRPEESLQQYFARLPWHYLLASEDEAGEMAALYDRTFFGLKEPSEEELERHRAFAARFRPKTLRQRIIWYGLQ